MPGIALLVEPDAEALAVRAADLVAAAVAGALAERGAAHVSLAGGRTPRRAYELLAARLPDGGAGLELWFGDERAVGPADPDSNFRMVAEALLPGLPAARVHRIRGELGAREAARAYAEELGRSGVERLDLALLGLGEDGHTASLFPGDAALAADGAVAPVRAAPKPPPERITLTLPTLLAARARLLLASGAGKAAAVAALRRGPDARAPASLLGGEATTLLADRAAAGEGERADREG